MDWNIPEPSVDPPEDFYMIADCGHEVYEGEHLIEWQGKQICPDCFKEDILDLPVWELAALLGASSVEVGA